MRGPSSRHIALGPGPWTIELLLGEPEQLPSDAAEAEPDGEAAWRRLAVRVIITPDE